MSADPSTPLTIGLIEFIVGIVTGAVAICAFVFDQFRRTREKAQSELSQFKRVVFRMVSKHNKEDDENFGAINDNIHDIANRIASHFGQAPPAFRTLRKRRYLIDDGGPIK